VEYISTNKIARLAGEAFANSLRLNHDSITMYKNESYATSLQLAVLAQEELGKAFLLEETVFRTGTKEWLPSFQHETLQRAFSHHKLKQSWFNRFAEDFTSHSSKALQSKFTKDILSGKLDEQKQNATYTGLPRLSKGFNLKGRIITPRTTSADLAARQITRFNDLVVVYAEGFSRGIYGSDVYEIAKEMNQDLVQYLNDLWPQRGRDAKAVIKILEKSSVIENPLSNWED
jgi:AbiV family abortive infection protein